MSAEQQTPAFLFSMPSGNINSVFAGEDKNEFFL